MRRSGVIALGSAAALAAAALSSPAPAAVLDPDGVNVGALQDIVVGRAHVAGEPR